MRQETPGLKMTLTPVLYDGMPPEIKLNIKHEYNKRIR